MNWTMARPTEAPTEPTRHTINQPIGRVVVALLALTAASAAVGLNPILAAASVATGLAAACAAVLLVTSPPGGRR